MERGVLRKLRLLFVHPYEFFDEAKREKSILGGFELFFLASVFALLVQIVIVAGVPLLFKALEMQEFASYIIVNTIFIAVSIIGLFVSTFIVHALIRLFGGKGEFAQTFNVFAYSLVPFVIFSFIPFFSIFAAVYTIFLLVIGLMKMHSAGAYKTIFALLIPFTAYAFIMAGVLFYFLSLPV